MARIRRRPPPAPVTGTGPGALESEKALFEGPGTARRAILTILKRHGPLQTQRIASLLGRSVPAVRQQLLRLTEDGFVLHSPHPRVGKGRPAHTYELSPAAEALFPKRYGDLASELLGYLGGPDDDQVKSLFEKRGRRRLENARLRLEGLDLEHQVAELARILDEDGYLADVQRTERGKWLITEHNCAILSVAKGYREACSSELSFIRDALPAATVRRVAHMMSGAHVCAYEVTENPDPGPPEARRGGSRSGVERAIT